MEISIFAIHNIPELNPKYGDKEKKYVNIPFHPNGGHTRGQRCQIAWTDWKSGCGIGYDLKIDIIQWLCLDVEYEVILRKFSIGIGKMFNQSNVLIGQLWHG